jgi:hypothetical protein
LFMDDTLEHATGLADNELNWVKVIKF